ncbi:helix-turn-helix transcriptional regulator [Streptomyces sp. NBC_01207]|uniref:helix-turn-helix transcriptional regulator n=1 Tax=Streptomyces sp. NBC_01207 TaxID=2903772 RepID=UPI002E167BD0|nr:hypothetical protein OG457_27240 [Streptomyces sp. NBC_01207]
MPELLSIAEIAQEFSVSRQTLHTARVRGGFPEPVPVPGSTRQKWDRGAVAAYFQANPKRPGTRTDLHPRRPATA